jgi:hypothetical protein
MWPFKKKKSPQKTVVTEFETIICIPGNWKSREEFILVIVASSNGEYMAAGNVLIHARESRHFTIEFCEHDVSMKNAFKYAGMVNMVSDAFIDEIEQHRNVIYITGNTGNMQEARHISLAASAILKSGGIGIKIETAGKAFEKDQWLSRTDNFEESNLYDMFVVDSIFNGENNSTYSCGMQNIGLKDTIVFNEDFQYAASLIRIFGFYQIIDKPEIIENQTFSMTIDDPKFRIVNDPDQPYKGDKLFENPFGMWQLIRV